MLEAVGSLKAFPVKNDEAMTVHHVPHALRHVQAVLHILEFVAHRILDVVATRSRESRIEESAQGHDSSR
jgi:hypothetical protein